MKIKGLAWCLLLLQDALSQLRGVSSSGISRSGDPLETLQSRARELEKKVCVIDRIIFVNHFRFFPYI